MAIRWNRFYLPAALPAMITMLLLFHGHPAGAQSLMVEQAVICKNVVDRTPVDAGRRFPASVAKLFCFCKIVGADHPTKVVHVWYLDGTERGRVTLAVNGSPWRTYSSKRLRSQDTGTWHVDILDADGNLLDHLPFIIEP